MPCFFLFPLVGSQADHDVLGKTAGGSRQSDCHGGLVTTQRVQEAGDEGGMGPPSSHLPFR